LASGANGATRAALAEHLLALGGASTEPDAARQAGS